MLFDISQVLFSAGAIVFAIGLGRAGSATARRPLGTGAIIALAVWQLVMPLVMLPFWSARSMTDDFVAVLSMVDLGLQIVTLMLAVIAVVQVARIGVVPRLWNLAPMWALVVIVVARVIPEVVGVSGAAVDQAPLIALYELSNLVQLFAVATLGVLAIVLALRPQPGASVVYSSSR